MTDSEEPQEPTGDVSARDKTLGAAVSEFAQHGFAAARVDGIARAAGVNKQLIYYYFKSKVGLREAVLEEMVDRYRPFWDAVSKSTLRGLLQDFPATGSSQEWLPWRRLLTWEGVEYLENAHREIVLEDTRSRAYGTQTDMIRREQAAGALSLDVDAEALSLLLVFARLGPFILPQVTRMVMGGDATADDARDAVARTLAALVRRPEEQANAGGHVG